MGSSVSHETQERVCITRNSFPGRQIAKVHWGHGSQHRQRAINQYLPQIFMCCVCVCVYYTEARRRVLDHLKLNL